MLLKNHLIEVFKQASLENNFLLKENVVLKWVHRFGIDSLNDLLINSSLQENQREEENQEHISLIDEDAASLIVNFILFILYPVKACLQTKIIDLGLAAAILNLSNLDKCVY